MAVSVFSDQQIFVKVEAAFKDTTYTGFAATDAILARTVGITAAHNRVPNREKRSTPDYVTDLPRLMSAAWNLSAAWQPSGTIGIESDLAPLFTALQGTKRVSGSGVTTTVASGGAVSGAVLASATGLTVGDVVIVTTSAGREATRIASINTNTVTWSPSTSAVPSNGAAVVAGVNYVQSTAIPTSLAIGNYLGSIGESLAGAMVARASIGFTKSEEIVVSFDGPGAQYYADATKGTKPVSQTTVGSPINGLVALANVNGYVFKLTGLTVSPTNPLALRDQDLGATYATEAFRSDRRDVSVQASFYVEDLRVANLATALTKGGLSVCFGNVNGAMVGAVLPSVLWEYVPLPSGETGPAIVTATGKAYASATGNDSCVIFEA